MRHQEHYCRFSIGLPFFGEEFDYIFFIIFNRLLVDMQKISIKQIQFEILHEI